MEERAMSERRVLFIDEVAARLGCSTKTIRRRLKAGTFPIRPLRSIDDRHRWSLDDVVLMNGVPLGDVVGWAGHTVELDRIELSPGSAQS
jgi:predicted DNA-binding transcriptional regulator AlpA